MQSNFSDMKKIIYPIVLAFAFCALIFCSCGKKCECREWLNGYSNDPYPVDLEGDGNTCESFSTVDPTDTAMTGIQCYEIP